MTLHRCLLLGCLTLLALGITEFAYAVPAIPSVPEPSGVTLSSNPLDDGVTMFQWAVKVMCALIAVAALGTAAALGMPKFAEASRGKVTYGDASFNLFMLILGAVIVVILCAYVYGQTGGGALIGSGP